MDNDCGTWRDCRNTVNDLSGKKPLSTDKLPIFHHLSVKMPVSTDRLLIFHHLSVKMPVFTDKVQREGD